MNQCFVLKFKFINCFVPDNSNAFCSYWSRQHGRLRSYCYKTEKVNAHDVYFLVSCFDNC